MKMMLSYQLETRSKRKREEGRYANDGSRPPGAKPKETSGRDCYLDSLAGILLLPDGSVRSSWLSESHAWTHSAILHEAKRHYGVVPLREQIRAAHQQLCQLKQRFGPVAEKCAAVSAPYYLTNASHEFQEARRMCNPFESLGEGQNGGLNRLFMNRAAIKLANIDAVLDFQLTSSNGGLRFVDLCGAPGGFSEYLMLRSQSNGLRSCFGYGMSLCGRNEHGKGAQWKLHHIINSNEGTFIQYSICNGNDGTGDVYLWENVVALYREIVSDSAWDFLMSESNKVHLVVADGGIDAQRDSECQEEVAQKIVVCQASAALILLQKGGTFVMKMFGFETEVCRAMMKSLVLVFGQIQVIKPISSRPASAERYVVFSEFKGVPAQFDGNQWRNQIFLGNAGGDQSNHQVTTLQSNLCDCLDECDRDILALNQKACFEILSYMERKAQVIVQGGPDGSWLSTAPRVDTFAYQRDWRLA